MAKMKVCMVMEAIMYNFEGDAHQISYLSPQKCSPNRLTNSETDCFFLAFFFMCLFIWFKIFISQLSIPDKEGLKLANNPHKTGAIKAIKKQTIIEMRNYRK